MATIKIEIGNKPYTVEVAETDAQKEQGLQNRKSLDEDKGMLFIFDEEGQLDFWMENTQIPLDIIFINEDLIVTSIGTGVPETKDIVSGIGTYVLELNQNSGVQVGDELTFSTNRKLKKSDKMLVLDSNGDVQMELDGGERIFSRKHTKTLIQFAKKAAVTDRDNDYVALGKRMFKFLQAQADATPEYVESKN